MLNNIGLPGLLLIAVVVLVLFGRGKISSLMGEVGKKAIRLRSFSTIQPVISSSHGQRSAAGSILPVFLRASPRRR